MIVAFDCDGTLYKYNNTPNWRVIDLLRWFNSNGDRVIVWSGGGREYAEHVVQKLGLTDLVDEIYSKFEKLDFKPDLAIDDEIVELGIINLKV